MTPERLTVQRGFTLIEVLIALVVLSIGLLGAGFMQIDSVRSERTALARTKAVNFAADMADRIRANPGAGTTYAGGVGANNNCSAGFAPAVDCNPVEMAEDDLLEWMTALASPDSGIAGAIGTIVFDNTAAPPSYVITIAWNEPVLGALSYSLSVRIR